MRSDPGRGSFGAIRAADREPAVPPDDGRLRLVLVRHGRTDANVAHRLDTTMPGPPLDDVGRKQAEEVAGLLADWPVGAIYASIAARARETAAPIASRHGLDVEVLDGVHEISVGDLNGRDDDEARATFDDVFASWWAGDLDRPQPGGESASDLLARLVPDVRRVCADDAADGAIVLVSHGAAIRLGVAALLAGRDDARYGQQNLVPNTGRVVLRRDPDGWTLETWDPMPGA